MEGYTYVGRILCEHVTHIAEVIRDAPPHADWTNSAGRRAVSTNSIISHIWKVLGLHDSLLERKHDLYRSLLHLAQLMPSCCLRHEIFALLREMWESRQKEMQGEGVPGKEKKVGISHQSINQQPK